MALDPIVTAPATLDAIRAHAVACFPAESCGVVTPDGFVPLPNRAENPKEAFDCAVDAAEFQMAGTLLAIVHSHPAPTHDGVRPTYPSAADMAAQIEMDVPWGLCASSQNHASKPYFWGPGVDVPKLAGRRFRHGPSGTDGRGDCYALIRDYFLLEKNRVLPEFPRDWDWWVTRKVEDGNLYEENFEAVGFRTIPHDQVRVGDCALVALPNATGMGSAIPLRANHAGVYVGDGLVLHHLPPGLSKVEPLGEWNRLVRKWVRHADDF